MDPYLEGSEWMSVHTELSSEIARQLAPKLRPKYIVRTVRRFVMETPDDITISYGSIYPDVSVSSDLRGAYQGEPVVATTEPLLMTTVIPAQIPVTSIEIRDVAERELVTAIEVLSPVNKRGEGYAEYLDKRRRMLLSTAHLLEIDLLRLGKRVPMHEPLPLAPYFIFLSRAERRPTVEVWQILLSQPLPTVPVPLLSGDADVMLDLQLALTNLYDALGYDLSADYTQAPEVPLGEEDARWATERLRDVGIMRR
jgi:hypothetical protein